MEHSNTLEDKKDTPSIPEAFTSSKTNFVVGEKKYTLRILKMNGSTMLFLSNQKPECFDEMAIAMPMPGDKKEVVSTCLIGEHMRLNSYRLAEKLSKRFDRQFVISHNADVDRITEPVLEKDLIEFIKNHKEKFV